MPTRRTQRFRFFLPRATSVVSASSFTSPENAETLDPFIDLAERRRVDDVNTARTLSPRVRETALAQNTQMLRNSGLTDAKLGLNDVDNFTGGLFAIGEQLKDPPPHGIAKHIEGMHQVSPL